jgi:hypothetical protein
VDTQTLVGCIESGIHPGIHLLPKGQDLGLSGLPVKQHLLHRLHTRSFFLRLIDLHAALNEHVDFLLELLVKAHVVFANKVIALESRLLGCLALAEHLPGVHAFANMHPPVIDDLDLNNRLSRRLNQLCHRVAQEIVPDVPQVQGLIGIG